MVNMKHNVYWIKGLSLETLSLKFMSMGDVLCFETIASSFISFLPAYAPRKVMRNPTMQLNMKGAENPCRVCENKYSKKMTMMYTAEMTLMINRDHFSARKMGSWFAMPVQQLDQRRCCSKYLIRYLNVSVLSTRRRRHFGTWEMLTQRAVYAKMLHKKVSESDCRRRGSLLQCYVKVIPVGRLQLHFSRRERWFCLQITEKKELLFQKLLKKGCTSFTCILRMFQNE